jgi:hypothetical protein
MRAEDVRGQGPIGLCQAASEGRDRPGGQQQQASETLTGLVFNRTLRVN